MEVVSKSPEGQSNIKWLLSTKEIFKPSIKYFQWFCYWKPSSSIDNNLYWNEGHFVSGVDIILIIIFATSSTVLRLVVRFVLHHPCTTFYLWTSTLQVLWLAVISCSTKLALLSSSGHFVYENVVGLGKNAVTMTRCLMWQVLRKYEIKSISQRVHR